MRKNRIVNQIIKHKWLILLLVITFILRIYRFDYPNTYVFDEVYHGFTAKEFARNEIKAWEWWNTPPPGVAYEWTHPPLAKEIMALSLMLFKTEDPWAWRLPGIIFGVISVYLVYLLTQKIFKKEIISLLAAAMFSLDGLLFVQSRTGMNDIYVVSFMLASLLLLLHKRFLLSALFFGCALASKWSALYLYSIILIIIVYQKSYIKFLYFVLIPPLVYIASYIPFFLLGHSLEQFKGLQQQMWWYHSGLKATHDYASPWWSWPFNFFPVWYYVDYQGEKIANIFASGNPMLFWFGFMGILMTIYDAIKERSTKLGLIVLAYFAFLLPWALSPRIMFLYHYSPSIPFMCMALAYQLSKFTHSKQDRIFLVILLTIIVLSFAFIYPFLTGLPLDKPQVSIFFKTNITKNPFGPL